jgi:dTDP-4-dehydrorhamnose 3,5-epimerase
MPFVDTDIPGLLVFEPIVHGDSRGYFLESYNEKIFRERGLDIRFVQDNESASSYGVIRGLHYQLNPFTQVKLIRVLHGAILDVVVDIRKNSPTYSRTFSIELSGENKKQLFIPGGFAHGFSVLTEKAVVMYKCDHFYHKESERGIRFDDQQLLIDWKIPVDQAIISDKDRQLPSLAESENNFQFKN